MTGVDHDLLHHSLGESCVHNMGAQGAVQCIK